VVVVTLPALGFGKERDKRSAFSPWCTANVKECMQLQDLNNLKTR